MAVHTFELVIDTAARGFVDITAAIDRVVGQSAIASGLVNILVRHTSASLVIGENADPSVREDLERFVSDLVRDGDRRFTHTAEGPDDMASHIRSVLTTTSLSVPIRAGRAHPGTWQGIYLWEHRHAAHRRAIDVTVVGE